MFLQNVNESVIISSFKSEIEARPKTISKSPELFILSLALKRSKQICLIPKQTNIRAKFKN